MTQAAHVESIDALKALRTALVKFADSANAALGDAESEMQRTLIWLETEQHTYWQSQFRQRAEAVAHAKEAVRMKTLFKDATGRRQSAVDEQKALAIAQRRLEEAEQKLANVRRSARLLQKEFLQYKGSVQRFAGDVESEIPVAASRLERMVAALEAYVALQGPSAAGLAEALSQAAADAGPTMVRGDVEPALPAPPAQTAGADSAGGNPPDQPPADTPHEPGSAQGRPQ